jgi:glycosyltransferase involved in cell wall biosynthesis
MDGGTRPGVAFARPFRHHRWPLPEKKRILYAFPGGRRARLADIEAGVERPTEFLYGYSQLPRAEYEVDLVEAEAGAAPRGTVVDSALNHLAARLLGIGINTPAYVAHLPRLAACDGVVAAPDSCALAFARLKATRRAPNVPLIYVAMGLAAGLERVMRRRPFLARGLRSFYAPLLAQCSAIVALGRGEYEFLRRLFPAIAPRVHFVPFGVDTRFWRPDGRTARDGTFLFVGNDPNRAFGLVASIVRHRPDLRFRIVSSHGALQRLDAPNAETRAGDWKRQPLSDDQLRDLYRRSLAVILPLRESLQPSGQSVTLQAIACGTPVLITRTAGFWEPEAWTHGEHCYFVDGHDVAAWSKALDEVAADGALRARLASQGAALVADRYSVDAFAARLAGLLDDALAVSRG